MISHEEALSLIKERQTPKRYTHSLQVAEIAASLAEAFGVDREKADIAGLLHDYAKNLDQEILIHLGKNADLDPILLAHPHLLHGPVGAYLLARDDVLADADVLKAIAWHTVGERNMDSLGRIIYVADYLASHHGIWNDTIKERYVAWGLPVLTLWVVQNSLRYLDEKKAFVHPETLFLLEALQLEVKEREALF